MSNVGRRIIYCFLFLGLSAQVSAQNSAIVPKTNSPYSRFGLGDPVEQFFAASGAMGGISAAFSDPNTVNLVNPASLANLRQTAFEIGLYARTAGIRGGSADYNYWSGNLNYISLAFPLRNPINTAMDIREPLFNWGMALALRPYTLVGYNINTIETLEGAGAYSSSLKGTGGTYLLSWGNGWQYKNLSVGAQLGYLFGKLTNSRRVLIDESGLPSYATELQDDLSVSGWAYDLGVQWALALKTRRAPERRDEVLSRLVLGAYTKTAADFNTTISRLYHRDNFNLIPVLDTMLYQPETTFTGALPAEYGFGVAYELPNRLRLGVDYRTAAWSNYRNEAKPEQLADNWRLAFGAEYIPDYASYNDYFERVRYRFGAFYGTDPRSVNGAQLQEYGLTLGLGMPILMPRQRVSYFNLALEIGRFGPKEGLRENFLQITAGLTLNDNSWFFKRKFN